MRAQADQTGLSCCTLTVWKGTRDRRLRENSFRKLTSYDWTVWECSPLANFRAQILV